MKAINWSVTRNQSDAFLINVFKSNNLLQKPAVAFVNLTSFSSPAQSFVLPEDSANCVPIVGQRHHPLSSKTLLVVSHEGTVANPSTCTTTQLAVTRTRWRISNRSHVLCELQGCNNVPWNNSSQLSIQQKVPLGVEGTVTSLQTSRNSQRSKLFFLCS